MSYTILTNPNFSEILCDLRHFSIQDKHWREAPCKTNSNIHYQQSNMHHWNDFFIPPSLPRASKSKSQSSRTLPSRIPDTKVSNLTIDWSFQCPGPPLVVCKIWRQWLQVKLKVHRSKSIICGVCMIVGMGRRGGLFLCLGCSSSWMCCGNSLSSCRWCRL